MDAFFAAIEERDNPTLNGKPVIVGGATGSRGVVTTANYIARKYGIHAGMSLMEADKRCPGVIHVSTKGGKYTWVSMELMAILRRFSPKVEPYSIDEAFLDLSGCIGGYNEVYEYGNTIKSTIKKELNLTASMGVAPSKIVAKIGSGMNKPDGLTIIPRDKIYSMLSPLAIKKIPGVGPATREILEEINIYKIKDLIGCNKSLLKIKLGSHGSELWRVFHGKNDSEVVSMERHVDDKSMGHENTFRSDVKEKKTIYAKLLLLCDKTARRMRKFDYYGRVISVKLRTYDFNTQSHQHKLNEITNDPIVIYNEAKKLLSEMWTNEDKAIRLIGVSMSGLIKTDRLDGIQEDLFRIKEKEKRKKLFNAVDTIKDQFGENSLGMAGYLDELKARRYR